MWIYNNDEYLAYHGILGMKWGIRRYQNKDGTLTAAGLDCSPMQRWKPVAAVLLQISDMNDFKQEREENYVSNSN